MLRTGIVLLLICLICPGVALAGEAADLMAQIDVKKTELGEAVKKEDELTAQNEMDFKKYKVLADNHAELEKRAQAIVDNFKANTAKQVTYRDGLVENWNAQCAANRVGALPTAQYNSCLASGAEVDKVVAGINSDIERQQKQALADIQPLVDAGTRQENEMAAIDARMKARFKAWQDAKDIETRVKADLDRLHAELARKCADKRTPEDVKFCASIGWDGTNQKLPRLDDLHQPLGSRASPNN